MLLVVLLALQLNGMAGASLGITSGSGGGVDAGGEGFGGSVSAYHSDENDRVSMQYSDSDSEYSNPDQVIKTVVNINDSNTAALLLNFNVSKDEILRRISAQSNAPLASEAQGDDEVNATTMEGHSE